MKSKHIIAGMAALTIGAAFTSCSHDFEYDSIEQQVLDTYNRIFIETFGEPAADQDWGFGTATTKGLTRAAFTGTWNGNHTCGVDESKFNFTKTPSGLPTGAIDLSNLGTYNDQNGNNTNAVYYVPSTFNGSLSLNGIIKFKEGMVIYNYGTITGIDANWEGKLTVYNAGKWNWTVQSGGQHTIINTGTLILADDANIGDLYNGGHLEITDTDVRNSVSIYSKGDATINMPTGGDLKSSCDIHGTITVPTGNLKIQNSTTKYVCGVDVKNGTFDNVDGPLITSYVKANEIKFDGNPIYLLHGGYLTATTIKIPNSNCHVYAVAGSTALVEATNFEFGNKNDFTHTFSPNIYFKVNGGYVKVENCYAMGSQHDFANIEEYLAYDGHNASQSDEYQLAKDRINAGNATGSPACGQAWTVGTPDDGEIWDEWARIIVEDLSATSRTDFDFNDAVFDVRINSAGTKAQILLKAAGGTLPLTIGWSGEEGTSYSGFEVHNMYGVATNVMVNTNAKNGVNGLPDVPKTLTGTFKYYDDIKVMVCKRGEWIEIKAFEGQPAGKIQVKPTYEWCKERRNIYDVYNGEKAGYRKSFLDYVKDPNVGSSWYEK